MLEILNFAGGAVACEHDLFMTFVQGIKGMEELLLNPLLASQELDVVDQQHIRLPVFFAKTDKLIVLDAIDVLIGELFRGDVSDATAFFMGGHVMADRMQQVSLPQTNTAIEKKRVIGFAGCLGHGEGG